MTTDAIDYYFWINSDWAYFWQPAPESMGERYGLPINYYPVDIGAVYARTGGIKLPLRSKERRDYRLLEMRRFRDILGMPITLEPKHMTQSVEIPSRFAIAAMQMGIPAHDLVHAIMTALWVERRTSRTRRRSSPSHPASASTARPSSPARRPRRRWSNTIATRMRASPRHVRRALLRLPG